MNQNLLDEFRDKLLSEILPGEMLAMVEERTFAVKYGDEIFMVYDPLEGYYGLATEFITLIDYMKVRNLYTIDDVLKSCHIYEEAKIREYLSNAGIN